MGCVSGDQSNAEDAKVRGERVIGVSRGTGSDVCLGQVGGRAHNLVERSQINNIAPLLQTDTGGREGRFSIRVRDWN